MVCLRTEFRKEATKTEPNPLHNYHHSFSNSPPDVLVVVVVKAVLSHQDGQLHPLVALDSNCSTPFLPHL